MTIDQVLWQLEQQKDSIERAISALKEVSGTRIHFETAVTPTAGVQAKKRRGRPPRNQDPNVTGTRTTDSERQTTSGQPKKRGESKARVKRPVYTEDFRRRVVTSVRNGMSFGEAAKKFNTTWFSVREWINSGRFEPLAAKTSAPDKKKMTKAKKPSTKGTARKKASVRSATKNGSWKGPAANASEPSGT